METEITFDERIRRYEKRVFRKPDGTGHVVKIDPGTRIYREVGHVVGLRMWLREVQEDFEGELVPFEWVADYVGVSRAALHKRVNRGGLTVLAYQMQEVIKGILGGRRERMRTEYKYVPRSECDSWRELLNDESNQPET